MINKTRSIINNINLHYINIQTQKMFIIIKFLYYVYVLLFRYDSLIFLSDIADVATKTTRPQKCKHNNQKETKREISGAP